MKSFEDAKKRVWVLDITVSALRRIRLHADLDLGKIENLTSGTLAERLASDPILLADVLYAIVKPEAERREISREDFCDAISGDILAEAPYILFEALADFFPSQQGAFLRRLLALAREQYKKATNDLEKMLQGYNLERMMTSGEPSTDSPASSESTPAP